MDRHVLVLFLRGQLVLEAVDIDEDAVQLFLVGFQLFEVFIDAALPEQIAQFQRAADFGLAAIIIIHGRTDGGCIDQLPAVLDDGQAGKVPGGFKGVPV